MRDIVGLFLIATIKNKSILLDKAFSLTFVAMASTAKLIQKRDV